MPDVDSKEAQPEGTEQTDSQLDQEREELRRIGDLIPQQIVVLNPEGKALYANRVSMDYTGLSLEEVRADDFRDRVFHPEDIQRLREQRQKADACGVRAHSDSGSVRDHGMGSRRAVWRRREIGDEAYYADLPDEKARDPSAAR